jgi:putative oxidoreductase
MKAKLPLIARILLGLLFFVFGLMGLFNLVPPPPGLPENMIKFTEGLMASGYFMVLLKLTETICGLLLLLDMFVPLALVILAPIVLNIFLVHAFMQPEGLPIAVVIGALTVYLAFFAEPYASKLKPLFRKK